MKQMPYHHSSRGVFFLLMFVLCILPLEFVLPSDYDYSAGNNIIFLSDKKEENDEGDPVELENVIVTATRTEAEVLDVPEHVTVITDGELILSKAKDVAEVLGAEAGISLIDYGPEGSLQALSLRGSSSAQVLVLINGVRAYGSHGGADMSLIPLENIERIEIVRGGTSALYGADAVGGVINIITKKESKNRICLKIENTSYPLPDFTTLADKQYAHADFSYTIQNLSINTSINGTLANNEFQYIDSEDRMKTRKNADMKGGDVSCNVYYSLPSGFMNLSGTGVYHDQGSPGSIVSLTPEARQIQTALGTSFQYKTESFFTDILTLDLKAYYNYFKLDYTNPEWSEHSLHTTHSGGIDLSQEIFPSDLFSILYGGALYYEWLDSLDMGTRDRLNCAGFAEAPVYLDSFILLASIRYDFFSDFGNTLNFKAGITWKLLPSLSLKSNFSKSFRAPTFNDLYWPSSTWAVGNPDLKPETGYCGDLGLTLIKEKYSLNFFIFLRYIEDVILWMTGDDFIWRPENYEKGLYPGVEAQCEIKFLDNLKAGVNYTFLYSFALSGDLDIGDDVRIPYVPVHSLDASLLYTLLKKNTFAIKAHYEGRKYINQDNSKYLPSLFLLDVSYTLELTKYFSFYIAFDNLFNIMAFGMDNYPLPGFSLRTGFEVLFQ
ncbi:MAG: TonB-dependent receptor [Spirochaetales bacterium]|nr:TonB-dependent receptor [Spirochaetales bacterium]